MRGKIIHILEQDSYRNEGLSVYEISRNGTTTKLNNKVQGLNQKESRLRGRCIARKALVNIINCDGLTMSMTQLVRMFFFTLTVTLNCNTIK